MRIANGPRTTIAMLALLGAVVTAPAQSAEITIVNNNAAGVGFNDPTPAAPVGGTPGLTVGAQRLYVFQYAANIWGALLPSAVQIDVLSQFATQTCTATSAVLGSAGPAVISRDFAGAPFPGHWYHIAEANRLAGVDLAPPPGPPAFNDINATFNSALNGNVACLGGTGWYYGVDGNEGANIELLPVVLHELGHGLGFSTSTSGSTGNYNGGVYPTIFDKFLYDATTGQHWDVGTTPAQRAASAISCGGLRWDGPSVMSQVGILGPRPNLHINAPVVADMQVGEAAFGNPLSAGSVTGPVTLVNDGVAAPDINDACEALVPGSLTGQIALVTRGTCGFIIKVKNCQDAGALAVIVADNTAGCPPAGLGGADPTITIPSVRVTLPDGNALKLMVGLNVTLNVDPTLKAGADVAGRFLMYSPVPFASGSSVSHFDVSASPNILMEPAINNNLSSGVDATLNQMADIGWLDPATPIFVAPGHVQAGNDGVRIEFYSGKALEGTWTSYRRIGSEEWATIGAPEILGRGVLILKDSNVVPGGTYQYRLGAIDNTTGEQSFSEIVTVTVPVATTFALEGAVPNPAGRNLRVAYTLGGVSKASIALYNVAGRALKTVDLTGSGVGRKTIDMGDGLSLAPGTYFVRLVQGDKVATSPVIVQ
jgi:hypothetical protein